MITQIKAETDSLTCHFPNLQPRLGNKINFPRAWPMLSNRLCWVRTRKISKTYSLLKNSSETSSNSKPHKMLRLALLKRIRAPKTSWTGLRTQAMASELDKTPYKLCWMQIKWFPSKQPPKHNPERTQSKSCKLS